MAFGKKIGGGRRFAERLSVGLAATINSIEFTGRALVEDVSATGARLSSTNLPRIGQDVWIRVGATDVLATVVWKENDECGVVFDTPLNTGQLHLLRAKGEYARNIRLSPDENIAIEDWMSGLAR